MAILYILDEALTDRFALLTTSAETGWPRFRRLLSLERRAVFEHNLMVIKFCRLVFMTWGRKAGGPGREDHCHGYAGSGWRAKWRHTGRTAVRVSLAKGRLRMEMAPQAARAPHGAAEGVPDAAAAVGACGGRFFAESGKSNFPREALKL